MYQNIFAIARNTFRESIRSKILYLVLFFAVLVLLTAAILGEATVGDKVKVIKDFGLFCISLSSVAFAVIAGSLLLANELGRKTILNVLSKAVRRSEFVAGKFFGLVATLGVLTALMIGGLMLFCRLFEDQFDLLLLSAGVFIFFEIAIVCAAVLFFSTIVVTPVLSGLFSFGFFLMGRSAASLLVLAQTEGLGASQQAILTGVYSVLPHLHHLNISNEVVYGIAPSFDLWQWAALYTTCYCAALVVLGSLAFAKREFN